MEPLENKVEKAKVSQVVDRLSVGKAESEKLGTWLAQIQMSSKGFLALTKSDLINFLIRDHKAELSSKELTQIRSDNYEPIRHINWITQELKTALAKSDLATVAMLQEEIKSIELSVISQAKDISSGLSSQPAQASRKRRQKSKTSDVEPSTETPSIADLQGELPEA